MASPAITTVWCDRSQASDPRLRLQQRIARERAAGEIGTGGSLRGGATPPMGASSASEGRTFTGTGNLARKIRHHGAARTVQVGTVTGVGGVPMRLSATEVDDDEEDDYAHSYSMARQGVHNHKEEAEDWLRPGAQHRRADSGRSVGSAGHKPNQTYQPGHSRSPSDSIPHIAEEDTVAGPPYSASGPSYYPTGSLANARSRNGSRRSRTSSGSGGSGDQRERENSFGSMGPLREADSEATKNSQQESLDELKRRGSVDERAMTMSGRGVRLFVANPDLSD
ncbi:hypothetical protein EJ06DRAFT_519914 [Trichodelitschia bisporula]|uniref:Uncharacterized protein n=1 Tax=Trichodelitschia bisporula TaxID=703511 RepID=A0A6G1I4M9_9PEZI|nr:hypothetical protein EJ06DRAFT_519914 [Trichodelitschia bisporula]